RFVARNRRRGEEGAAAVEFAIVVILLITLTFAIIEYGWLFYTMHQVNNAAHAGVREAVLPDADQNTVTTVVDGALGGPYDTIDTDPADISEASSGDMVTVTVTRGYGALIGFVPAPSELSASATMQKEGP
ncbi:MAG: TadE/TadG family type IV pilus assembly protein, partial [Candidatus Hydrogenedentota bacterium]